MFAENTELVKEAEWVGMFAGIMLHAFQFAFLALSNIDMWHNLLYKNIAYTQFGLLHAIILFLYYGKVNDCRDF